MAPTDHVDVFVGTVKTGNTFPGATWPHGLAQLSPILEPPRGMLWHYNSGYHVEPGAASSRARGMGHTALSGTGLNDGGDFVLRPCERRAWLDHGSETARPGFYAARFACDGGGGAATMAAAAAPRGGVFEVDFDGDGDVVSLYLDATSPLDAVLEASAAVKGATLAATRSSRHTHHCAADHATYLHATFSSPPSLAQLSATLWRLSFRRGDGPLVVAVGLSHASAAGAARNAPQTPASLAGQADAADAAWAALLGRARVRGDDGDVGRFYTALYHAFLGPTLFSDADGSYVARGARRRAAEGTAIYSTFSLWDTYRAAAPLGLLLEPERAPDYARSLIAFSTEARVLPRWVLFGKDTGCARAASEAPARGDVFFDRHVGLPRGRGLGGRRAQESVGVPAGPRGARRGARDRDGARLRPGAAPQRPPAEHAGLLRVPRRRPGARDGPAATGRRPRRSRGLEAAVADKCVSRLAARLGDAAAAAEFERRAGLYREYYDADRRLMAAREPGGAFVAAAGEAFDPAGAFEEGTPLQYTFMVPGDAEGLAALLGGPDALGDRLDDYFLRASMANPTRQLDLTTGTIGGHCQGNEPGHHAPYLYNVANRPWPVPEPTSGTPRPAKTSRARSRRSRFNWFLDGSFALGEFF